MSEENFATMESCSQKVTASIWPIVDQQIKGWQEALNRRRESDNKLDRLSAHITILLDLLQDAWWLTATHHYQALRRILNTSDPGFGQPDPARGQERGIG